MPPLAEALNPSPRMVAEHVVVLEDRLGITRLARTTRRQNPIDVGRAPGDRRRQILADAEVADALAHDMRGRPTGVSRVEAPMTYGAFGPALFDTCDLRRSRDAGRSPPLRSLRRPAGGGIRGADPHR